MAERSRTSLAHDFNRLWKIRRGIDYCTDGELVATITPGSDVFDGTSLRSSSILVMSRGSASVWAADYKFAN